MYHKNRCSISITVKLPQLRKIIQTFLPYPNFAESAAVLDPKRLNKQIVEGNQILSTLLNGSKWQHHPAVLQFKGYENSLRLYIEAFLIEAHKRGFKTDKGFSNLRSLVVENSSLLGGEAEVKQLHWLGDERFHSSHRSRLLFKGRVDSVCGQLKKFLSVRSVNTWLKSNNYPEKNYFRHPDIERLEDFCQKQFDLQATNYYSKFNWSEDDRQEYFWPVKINS